MFTISKPASCGLFNRLKYRSVGVIELYCCPTSRFQHAKHFFERRLHQTRIISSALVPPSALRCTTASDPGQ